jgi:hypothetical protein
MKILGVGFDSLTEGIKSLWEFLQKLDNLKFETLEKIGSFIVGSAKSFVGKVAQTPFFDKPFSSGGGGNNINNNTEIIIQGSANSEATAKAVAKEQGKVTSDMARNNRKILG